MVERRSERAEVFAALHRERSLRPALRKRPVRIPEGSLRAGYDMEDA